MINPPDLSGDTPISQANRAWLLRAWLELGCILSHLQMLYGEQIAFLYGIA